MEQSQCRICETRPSSSKVTFVRFMPGTTFDAYRYISNADQKVRDVNRYAQQRGAFMGSALEIMRKLASFIEIKPVQKQIAPNRIQAVTKLGMPEPNKLSPLLLNLDLRRLNSLDSRDLAQIIETLDKKKRDGSFEMIEIEEKLDLVKEGDEWRIFLNWAVGVKIPFQLTLANAPDLDVALSKSEVVVYPGDLFEIERQDQKSLQSVCRRPHRPLDRASRRD